MVIDYHPSFLGCLLLSLQYGLPKVSRCKLPVGFAPQKVVNPPLSACRILIKGVNFPPGPTFGTQCTKMQEIV